MPAALFALLLACVIKYASVKICPLVLIWGSTPSFAINQLISPSPGPQTPHQ